MSATAPGPRSPGPQTLFDHALRLHRQTPDTPLLRDGEPYPDSARHNDPDGPRPPRDRSLEGAEAARILDEHFSRPAALPGEVADAFHGIYLPIHPNRHITEVAHNADVELARRTGRWLVRHGTDRCAVTVGLALLAAVGTIEDIPLIHTIGLLSNRFGPLAAHALERLADGPDALIWLADRVTGWGRVYVVEAICRLDHPAARPWLLRKALDGDFLNGYFAGKVATTARLHEALEEMDHDDEIIDHTGRLLHVMSYCGGMGATLKHYEHAPAVLDAHARNVGRLQPTVVRFLIVAQLAEYLSRTSDDSDRPSAQPATCSTYLAILDRDDWCEVARAGLAADDKRLRWLADSIAPQLGLRAFESHRLEAEE